MVFDLTTHRRIYVGLRGEAVMSIRFGGCWQCADTGRREPERSGKVAGVTLQIVRDWVLRFNADGPDGLATRKAPGRAANLASSLLICPASYRRGQFSMTTGAMRTKSRTTMEVVHVFLRRQDPGG